MPTHRPQPAAAAATTTTEGGLGLLDQVDRRHQADRADRAEDLIKTLTEEALKGTVTFDRNLTQHLRPRDRGDRRASCPSSSTRSCTTRRS